jgi:C4-dicarboxylate-specific signal transduction histidine kinase
MVKDDGSIVYVSLSCIVANNLDGIDVLRITITDITNRKMAEKELQKYKDHLEELVKTLTNELSIANENLQKEIIEHKKSKEELNIYTEQLKIFNDAMVNREIRIIELKIQINSLCEELGREPIYPPIWR